MFNGDGVPVYRQIILDRLGDQASFAPAPLAMQRAASIASLALEKAQRESWKATMTLYPFT